MIDVTFAPALVRQLRLLPEDLQDEAFEKIDLFKDPKNHQSLRVHKLKGRLNNRYSFSVNYRTRIVFNYLSSKNEVVLMAIGDHDLYN